MSDLLLVYGVPIGILLLGGFAKAASEGEPSALEHYSMAVELCTAAVVEAGALVVDGCQTNAGGRELLTPVCVGFVCAAALAGMIILSHYVRRKDDSGLGFWLLLFVGNATGITALAVILSLRGPHG